MNWVLRSTSIVSCFLLTISLLGCSSVFYFPSPDELVDRSKMPLKPEDVRFLSEDGTRLHGWYFRSKTPAKGLIVQFHGNAQNLSTHFFALYQAPSNGYDYFIFDYRGYGKSEGSPSPAGLVLDGKAALKWASEKAKKEDKPLIVFAQSLGGAVALRSLGELRGSIPSALIVVDSTFSSYRRVARTILERSWVTWIFQPLGWLLADNSKAPDPVLKNLGPAPVVVIHGTEDPVVDVSNGKTLFNQLPEPKELWLIPGGRHTDFIWRDGGQWSKKFFSLLDSHASK